MTLEKPRRPWYKDRNILIVILVFSVASILMYARYETKSDLELGKTDEILVGQNKTLFILGGNNGNIVTTSSSNQTGGGSTTVPPDVKEIKNLLTDINKTLSNPNRTLNVKNAS